MGKANRPSRDEILQRRADADEVGSYTPLARFLTGGQPLRKQPEIVREAITNLGALDQVLRERGWTLDVDTLSESGVDWEWWPSEIPDEVAATLDPEHTPVTYLSVALFDGDQQLITEPTVLELGLAGSGVMAGDAQEVLVSELDQRLPEIEAHRAATVRA